MGKQQSYTIHEHQDHGDNIVRRADELIFIKEGFEWIPLLFPLLWLIYHRMWLILATFISAIVILEVALNMSDVNETVIGGIQLTVTVIFAFFATDLRRWDVEQKGYRTIGTIAGTSVLDCERRFFDIWLAKLYTERLKGK